MQKQKSAKSFTIEAAMRNPKIKKALQDALTAPVGSSKRASATSMLSSIFKVSSKQLDGKGGSRAYSKKNPWTKFKMPPPMPYQPKTTDGQGGGTATGWLPTIGAGIGALASKAASYPGYAVEQAKDAGAMARVTGQGLKSLYQSSLGMGQMGLGLYKTSGQDLLKKAWHGDAMDQPYYDFDWTKTSQGQAAAQTLATPSTAKDRLVERYPTLIGSAVSPTAQAAPAPIPFKNGLSDEQKKTIQNLVNRKLDPNTWSATDKANWAYATNNAPLPSAQQPDLQSLIGPGLSVDKAGSATAGMVEGLPATDVAQQEQTQSIGDKLKAAWAAGESPGFDTDARFTDYTPASFSSLGASDFASGDYADWDTSGYSGESAVSSGLSGWERLQAVMQQNMAKGLGPEASIESILNDPAMMDELRALFPGVPDWAIPKGASLANHIAELKETKKQEMGLDALLDRQKELISRGVNLQDDLINYVKGKDEYISRVDQLMNDAKDKFLSRSDFDDPAVQKEYEQYMSYLTTLKGKQHKRYTDVLNDSINQHNNELTKINELYNNTLAEYNELVADQSAVSQEVYTRMYNALAGLYTTLGSATVDEDEAYMNQLKILKAEVDLAKAEFDLDEKISGNTSSDKPGDYQVGYTWLDKDLDPTTKYVSRTFDLASKMKALQDNGHDINAQVGLADALMSRLVAEMTSIRDKDSSEDDLSRVSNINNIVANYVMDTQFRDLSNPIIQKVDGIIKAGIPTLLDQEKVILEKYLLPKVSQIRPIITMLYGTSGTWGIGKTAPVSIEEAVKKMQESGMSQDLINVIVTVYKSGDMDKRDYTKFSDKELAQELANFATQGVARAQFQNLL